MRPIVALSGKRFGSLVVLGRGARLYEYSTNACWLVRCDCGTEKTIYGPSLKRGRARSCGAGQCHHQAGGGGGGRATVLIERHSPSSLNLFAASPAMFVLERIIGLRQPVGVPAHRGVAVEDGVTLGLLNPDAPLEACADVAYTKYDTLTAMSTDDRREKYRANIPDMVNQALAELRPYGVPSQTQGFIEWRPEGLVLPIVGYFDYHWDQHNITTDLKTTEKMPSKVKVNHARQVALYVTSNNAAARVTYCTPKKCQTYSIDNVDEHRKALHRMAVKVEAFLALLGRCRILQVDRGAGSRQFLLEQPGIAAACV